MGRFGHSTWVKLPQPQTEFQVWQVWTHIPAGSSRNHLLVWGSSHLLLKGTSFPVNQHLPWPLVFTSPNSFIFLTCLYKRLSFWALLQGNRFGLHIKKNELLTIWKIFKWNFKNEIVSFPIPRGIQGPPIKGKPTWLEAGLEDALWGLLTLKRHNSVSSWWQTGLVQGWARRKRPES